MILVSFDDFDQLAEFDPSMVMVQLWSRQRHPELEALVLGSFSRVNEQLVCLYRTGEILNLRIGDQEFQLTHDISSELECNSDTREFQLRRGPNTLSTITYSPAEPLMPLHLDPTSFVEEEHFDYLLFVHNVLTQPGRRHRI